MPKTYNQLYIDARGRLREAGVEAHSLEARLLVAFAADKTPGKLLEDIAIYSSDEIGERVERFMARRLAGEPLAYILGTWDFYGLELEVTPDVLIPRPDTEVLVSTALELVGGSRGIRFLDLGCGSGCIGCALGKNLSDARGVLAELSPAALEVAKRNAFAHDLETRLETVSLDMLSPPPGGLGTFDLIVSNPPYIKKAEIETLDKSVRAYEPHMALDGGEDGLDFYRAILKNWKSLLRTSGHMVFEVGETQAEEVIMLMRLAGLRGVRAVEDTAGIQRVVCGRI